MSLSKQLSKLRNLIMGETGKSQPARRNRLRRLLIEQMEDRRLLTTIDLGALVAGQGSTIFGTDTDDQSGISVSNAGDVNGDGFDDFIIGAQGADASGNVKLSAGESYVVFGASSLPATIDLANLGSMGFTIFGVDSSDLSAYSVSSAGDVNGDGFDDLIIGARFANASGNLRDRAGESYVIFGAASLPAIIDLANLGTFGPTVGITIFGADTGDQSGQSVSGAGDVNGDGFDDLLIGANRADASGNAKSFAGDNYVIFGAASLPATIDLANVGTLEPTVGITIFGADRGDQSGWSVSSAGDVNGDGFDDLLVGAFAARASQNFKSVAGESYVIFGAASLPATIDLSNLSSLGPTVGITIFGADAYDRSGNSVSSAGDVNGDGFDDLLIGANSAGSSGNAKNAAGESYVIFGAASLPATIDLASLGVLGPTVGITIFGGDASDQSGSSVSSAGDVNGDGFDDLLIGAFRADASGNAKSYAGESYVIFGAASLPATIDLFNLGALGPTVGITIFGADAFDYSGLSVSSAGDVNGDGFDDLIIGARGAAGAGNTLVNAGESYVIFGGNSFTNSILGPNLGTDLANSITGTSATDILNGADGDDTLIGGGGADVLLGGRGNDILAVSDFNFNRIVGGNGNDTLRLDGSGLSLNLSSVLDNRLLGIETIDITGSGNNTLTLTAREVLNLSDSSNTLTVRRNSGDTVDLGTGWTQQADEAIGLDTFEVFTQGQAVLKTQKIAASPTGLFLSNIFVAENGGANAVVGTLTTTDPDAGDTFTYSLESGSGDTDNNAFTITGDQITINANPDFETKSSYSVRIRTTDQGGLFTEQEFLITVTDINESPITAALSANSIAENVAAGTTIGTLSTSDPDTANTFTYSFATGAGDTDNSSFTITGDQLTINASPNFEAQLGYSVRIRSTDQNGLFTEQAFVIAVIDANESPTSLALSSNSVAENVVAEATVGTLSTIDPDLANTFAYSFATGSGDIDNLSFTISGDQLSINPSPDFESKSSYSIRVRTTDQNGLFFEQDFLISVSDVNESPTNIELSNTQIPENAGVNAVVGTLAAIDPDTGNVFVFSLPSGLDNNNLFSLNGNILTANSSFDSEGLTSYLVTVQVTDGEFTFNKQFTIGVVNINEPPSIAVPAPQALAGNMPLVFSTANTNKITVADIDAGSATVQLTVTATKGLITLASTAGLTFILGASGQDTFTVQGSLTNLNAALDGLRFQPNLDFSGSASISLTLNDLGQSGLGGALTATQSIAINVASPAFVVDNSDLGYTESGSWVTSGITGVNGSSTRFSPNANAVATWNAPSLTPGFYSVAIWRVAVNSNSSNARVTVVHSGTTEPPQTINLSTGTSGFVELGTYYFSGAPGESVRLSQGTPIGFLRADSVRFNRMPPVANTAPSISAPVTQTVAGNTPAVFSSAKANPISIVDVDAGTGSVELTLTATNGVVTLSSTSGISFTSGANGQSTFTVQGTLPNLNAALDGMSFQPNLNFSGNASIALTVNDLGHSGPGGPLSASKLIAITVADPVFIVDNTDPLYAESGSWVTSAVPGINGSSTRFSPNANAIATWNAPTLEQGYYTVALWKVAVSSNSANARVTITHNGIVEPAQTVNLRGTSGFVELGTYFFSGAPGEFVRLSQGNPLGLLRADSVRFVRVPPSANLTPSITAPATQLLAGNAQLVFSAANANSISIADVDAGIAPVALTVSVSNGSITIPSINGLAFTSGTNGQSAFTVQGSLESINAALEGLTFQPTLNFSGNAAIALTINDLGNSGLGGPLSASKLIAVTVTSPVFIVDNSDAGYTESGTWVNSALTGVNGSTTRFSPNANAAAIWNAPSLAPGYYSVAVWKVVASSNSANASVSVVRNGITEPAQTINLATGLSGFVEIGTYFFSGAPGEFVRLSQGAQVGNLRADSVRFTRVPVANAAPSITAPINEIVLGNTPRIFSTANTNAISISDVDTGLASVQLMLSATNGVLTLPSTTGITFTSGTNGGSTFTVRGTLADLNTALNGLSYVPNANFVGSTSIQLTLNDLGNSGTGGPLSVSQSIALTVNSPVFVVDNSAPGYVETGAWVNSALVGFNGSNTRFAVAANAVATWNAPTPAPGLYSVAIWRVISATNSNNAQVTVVHNGISESPLTVDLSTGVSGFFELGTFYFSGVPGEQIRLSQGTTLGNLRADSVRFTKLP